MATRVPRSRVWAVPAARRGSPRSDPPLPSPRQSGERRVHGRSSQHMPSAPKVPASRWQTTAPDPLRRTGTSVGSLTRSSEYSPHYGSPDGSRAVHPYQRLPAAKCEVSDDRREPARLCYRRASRMCRKSGCRCQELPRSGSVTSRTASIANPARSRGCHCENRIGHGLAGASRAPHANGQASDLRVWVDVAARTCERRGSRLHFRGRSLRRPRRGRGARSGSRAESLSTPRLRNRSADPTAVLGDEGAAGTGASCRALS
jgi:hypothetical protein